LTFNIEELIYPVWIIGWHDRHFCVDNCFSSNKKIQTRMFIPGIKSVGVYLSSAPANLPLFSVIAKLPRLFIVASSTPTKRDFELNIKTYAVNSQI
jgi:hypothetical protein